MGMRRRQLQRLRWLYALLCWFALPALAHTQAPEELVLRWRAPAACPTEDSVRATVSSWLAQSSEPKATSGIEVEAVVRKDARGFVLGLLLFTSVI